MEGIATGSGRNVWVKGGKGPTGEECVGRYLCVKHSMWRGKYKRILCFVKCGVLVTVDPADLKVTNSWTLYGRDDDVGEVDVGEDEQDFFLNVRKDHKGQKPRRLRISCHPRPQLLTDFYSCEFKCGSGPTQSSLSTCYSVSALNNGNWEQKSLHVTKYSIRIASWNELTELKYIHFETSGIVLLEDSNDGATGVFAIVGTDGVPLTLFCSSDRQKIIDDMRKNAKKYIGIPLWLEKQEMTAESYHGQYIQSVEGKVSSPALAPIGRWTITKHQHKDENDNVDVPQSDPLTVEVSPTHIIERTLDYAITRRWEIGQLRCIFRCEEAQRLILDFGHGSGEADYDCSDRDSIISTLYDSIETGTSFRIPVINNTGSSSGQVVHFLQDKDTTTKAIGSESEKMLLNWLSTCIKQAKGSDTGSSSLPSQLLDYILTMNATCSQGIATDSRVDENLLQTLFQYLPVEWKLPIPGALKQSCIAIFQWLSRVVTSVPVRTYIIRNPGCLQRIFSALSSGSDLIAIEAVKTLELFISSSDSSAKIGETPLAQAAKYVAFGASSRLQLLVKPIRESRTCSPLLIAHTVKAISNIVCFPGKLTTPDNLSSDLLGSMAIVGKPFFNLFSHPAPSVNHHAAYIMESIAKSGTAVAEPLKMGSLQDGAFLSHLLLALFGHGEQGQTSKRLIEVWADSFQPALDLVKRIFPQGLYFTLLGKLSCVPVEGSPSRASGVDASPDQVTDDVAKSPDSDETVTESGSICGNGSIANSWEVFWKAVTLDHSSATLIWNERSRTELHDALDREEASLLLAKTKLKDTGGCISWNHSDFSVHYPSLGKELRIGGIYIRMLLDSYESSGALEQIPAPRDFFFSLYSQFLGLSDLEIGYNSTKETRELCLRAMAAVYRKYGNEIGPFDGVTHCTLLMDKTKSVTYRHRLLLLLQTLLVKEDITSTRSAEKRQWQNAIRKNAKAFVLNGGVDLCVDIATEVHNISSDFGKATQTKLLAYESHAETPREWLCEIEGKVDEGITKQENGLYGHLSRDEVFKLHKEGKINDTSLCWAPGMIEPMHIYQVRELRWKLCKGAPAFTAVQGAVAALSIARNLASLHTGFDADGNALHPQPLVHRQLAHSSCIPHLVQFLLARSPDLVEIVASLLKTVIQFNDESLKQFFKTGAFYFILSYPGSNFLELAHLLAITHKKQAFHTADTADKRTRLAERSYLGMMLPECMLHILDHYGPEVFAKAFVSENNTPEVVWTHEMRTKYLLPQIHSHVSEFYVRLKQHAHAVYEYNPMPPVEYPELEDEIWCYRYYLSNLCNEEKFPEWDIKDHVEFLQALLTMWRRELLRTPVNISHDEAYKLLELEKVGWEDGSPVTENTLKQAYRRLAKLYHPDKNPEGHEHFQEIHKAYDLLRSIGSSTQDGPRNNVILLVLKAQCILFLRYPAVLAPFKYAGYPLLLEGIEIKEDDQHFLSNDRAPMLEAGTKLCWLTCVCCELNGEELYRSKGIELLANIVERLLSVLPKEGSTALVGCRIMTYLIRTLAGLAAFQDPRAEVYLRPLLVHDILKSTYFENAPSIIEASIHCMTKLSASSDLQNMLLKMGMLWRLIPMLFNYDVSVGEEADGQGESERTYSSLDQFIASDVDCTNMQRAKNKIACLAARAITDLAGLLGELASPRNDEACEIISALFTPSLAQGFTEISPLELLRDLNDNIETPCKIWNNKMRAELLQHAEEQADIPNDDDEVPYAIGDLQLAKDFKFKALADELIIGGIYVRVFNNNPTFPLRNHSVFMESLAFYIGENSMYAYIAEEALDSQSRKGCENLISALKAALNIVTVITKLCVVYKEKTLLNRLLTCIASPPTEGASFNSFYPEVVALTLSIFVKLTCSSACVEALSNETIFVKIYRMLLHPPSPGCQILSLELLQGLSKNPNAAWSAATQGGAIYMLTLILPSGQDPKEDDYAENVQKRAISLLMTLCAEKVNGARLLSLLNRFLPPGLVNQLREGPEEATLKAFHMKCETPEHVWNPQMAGKLSQEVHRLAELAIKAQRSGQLNVPLKDEYRFQFDELASEVFIGGVYVRLFMAQPEFPLRNPKKFLEGLLKEYMKKCWHVLESGSADAAAANVSMLVLLSAATVALLRIHKLLAEHATGLGYATSFVTLLSKLCAQESFGDLCGSALRITHQLSLNIRTVEAIASAKPAIVDVLMQSFKLGLGAQILSLEIVKRCLNPQSRARDALVKQAIDSNLVQRLLEMLDWKVNGASDASVNRAISANKADEGSLKVLVVDILHLLREGQGEMSQSIADILDNSDIWKAYSQQKHDLFLPASTNSDTGVAGLLTGEAACYALPSTSLKSPNETT